SKLSPNFSHALNFKGLGFNPPLVIGFLAILLLPNGANAFISLLIFPFLSNNSSGL
ncbi:hypothetical protein CP02DC14_1238, partial [Chlamydia psittaci 02DC14]